MLKKISQLVAVLSAIILGCGFSSAAQALAFNQISQVYFFGDSLTDSGFNDVWSVPAPPPPGKAPTFTTFGGYTWAQYVARDVKGFVLPVYPGPSPADTITNNAIYAGTGVPGFVTGTLKGIDYAAGGSTTGSTGFIETWAPSLTQQIAFYLGTHGGVADPNAVYFIWSGANDLLTALSPATTQLQFLLVAQRAASNIQNMVTALAQAGAKRIVVLSLPNIGLTPLIGGLALADSLPTLPPTMKTVTFTFNSMLNMALGKVIAQYGIKVLYVDVYDLLDTVISDTQVGQPFVINGQSFLFVNYNSPACSTVPTSIFCPSTAPNNYIFADTLHPTNMAHRILSLQVEDLLQSWQ